MSRATIKDVAAKAGVSIATVSFVLNNHPGEVISEKVKKRVNRAARQLDYHPSAAAAGLARKRSRNLGLLIYRWDGLVSNQFYASILQGVIKEVMARDYNLLFCYLPEYKTSYDLPKYVREKNTEGVLMLHQIDAKLVKDIEARDVPVLAIDNYPDVRGLNSVLIDNVLGGQLAAQHLIELGHTEIRVLSAEHNRVSLSERVQSFVAALAAAKVPFDKRRHVVMCEQLGYKWAYEETTRLLRSNPTVTALFCINDEIASAAMNAAHDLGLKIPQDLSVVGFDDVPVARHSYPPLTTVGVPKEEMGRRATKRLLELIDTKERSSATKERVSVSLVVRESTGPAKGASVRALAAVKTKAAAASGSVSQPARARVSAKKAKDSKASPSKPKASSNKAKSPRSRKA